MLQEVKTEEKENKENSTKKNTRNFSKKALNKDNSKIESTTCKKE